MRAQRGQCANATLGELHEVPAVGSNAGSLIKAEHAEARVPLEVCHRNAFLIDAVGDAPDLSVEFPGLR